MLFAPWILGVQGIGNVYGTSCERRRSLREDEEAYRNGFVYNVAVRKVGLEIEGILVRASTVWHRALGG